MRTKKPRISFHMPKGFDLTIQICTLVLAVFGSIMVVSASMTITSTSTDLLLVGAKQIFYILIGYAGMLFLSRYFSFSFVKRHIIGLVIATFILLTLTLFFPEVNGAKAWIRIPFPLIEFTIQPAEFAKMIALLMFAVYLGDLPKNISQKPGEIVGPPLYVLIAMFFLMVFLQKDLGTAVVFFAICFFVFFLPSHRKLVMWQRAAMISFLFGAVFIAFILSDPGIALLKSLDAGGYQIQRFLASYNPFEIAQEGGYQIISSLVAFVKGNWMGVGLGRSLQKYGYLPAARTDFILAIVAEETGMVGVSVILLLYAFLIYRLFKGAIRATDDKSRMTLTGIALYLLLHFILNVGGVTALIPLTGVPLLFISQGGSSTMAIFFAIGIAQNILIKQKNEAKV